MARWICAPATLLLFVLPSAATPIQPLAVHDGRLSAVLATEQPGDQFLLILGSLRRTEGALHVCLTTSATSEPETVPLEKPALDPEWQQRVAQLAERQARSRLQRWQVDDFPPRDLPRHKVFHLLVKDTDVRNPGSYVAVTGELRGVGKYCQVYVDRNCPDQGALQPTIDDVIRTFDDEIRPRALGHVLDVDRDGRFTILMSGWLGRLQGGQVKVSGFVRGSDFYRDGAAPFSNCCDMMYLSTDLRPGPFLHTLLAHEYTHGIVFCEHVFSDYLPGSRRWDEESWLNEAISHLVEDRHGYTWANLDYRISAYLSAPQRYALVVADYYGQRIWRDPGPRGCTYLFLRWCVDRFGPDLLTRLVQSNVNGIDNLEVATQTHFAELFRQWSAAVALGGRASP
jgi:hypothetical protein